MNLSIFMPIFTTRHYASAVQVFVANVLV